MVIAPMKMPTDEQHGNPFTLKNKTKDAEKLINTTLNLKFGQGLDKGKA